MVQRMLGPEGMSATALAKDVGISQPTLSRWLRQAHSLKGMKNKTHDDQQPSRPPHKWTAKERFRVVLEAAPIPDDQLGAFLRKKGIHASHLEEWSKAAIVALQDPKKSKPSPEAKKIRELEKDLRRKEKALAEVTALLTLKKKVAEIWGDGDDATPTRKGT